MADPLTNIQVRAAGWAVKNIVWIVASVTAVLFIGWLFWHFIIAPMDAAHDTAVIRGQGVVDRADAAAAHGAVGVIDRTNKGEAGIAAKGRDHVVYINKQPGSDTVVPDPVWNAFIQSVCVRDASAGDPQCQRLREPHP